MSNAELMVTLKAPSKTVAGVNTTSHSTITLQLPTAFSSDDIEKSRNDVSILREIISEKKDDVTAMLNAVATNNMSEAKNLAHKCGISESNFVAGKGGIIGWVAAGVVLWLLLESEAH